jgi:tripartite-type tricarboxylate transporter receptor subunit TctC
VDKINAATLKAASAPAIVERLTSVGFEPNTRLSSSELAAAVKAEYDRNAGIVKAFNIQLNP